MISLLAQLAPPTIWNAQSGTPILGLKIAIALVVGILIVLGCINAPAQLRRPIVVGVTFLSGLFYVMVWAFPTPIARQTTDAPRGAAEAVSFWLKDAQPVAGDISNIIGGFLIGLGVWSLLRVHLGRILKSQKDWEFSLVLLVSMVAMTFFGYWKFIDRLGPHGGLIETGAASGSWGFQEYAQDLLFDGLYQTMESAMFSMIAFYILSAAYRSFRARSLEATILLGTALLLIVSAMGAIQFKWDAAVNLLPHKDPAAILTNLQISTIATWLRDNVQTPSIRGLEFGMGTGLLAIGLRLWLSLEDLGGQAG